MGDKTLNVRIKYKYDTESNWSSKNPILLKGEMAFSSDKNGKYKVGDGSKKWSQLTYAKADLEKSDVTTALGYTPPTSNTWRGIQNNLTSDATDQSLSAAQGKILKGLVDGKAPSNHTHNYAGSSSAGGAATSANKVINHEPGEGFEFGYQYNKTITIPKTTTVTTYYVQIGESCDFRFKNYYIKTNGDNTQYSFKAEISANAYMAPHVTLTSQRYNTNEIKNIEFYKAAKSSARHDIYLIIDSSTKVDKTIHIWADTEIVDTVSTTAPTTTKELTVNILSNDFIYTSKQVVCNITGSATSVPWTGITGKPSTFTPATHSHPNYLGAKQINGFYGMATPDGTDNTWIRTAVNGLIPYQTGAKGSGHGSLGTDSWYFSKAYIDNIYGDLTGNASTAIKLQTIRKINGTDFDGSADITTTNWGTSRNITIGNTKKSVNGSADISWSLTEIGASASDHTHKYAGSSSVAGAANSAVKLTTARSINGTSFDGSADITTAKWGTSRDITIGNKKKPLDGSAAVAWSLSEIGASAIGHKHTKSDITDFPDSLKNPKGLRFLLPAYEGLGNLNWIEDYDNALKPGTDIGYEIVENDRIKDFRPRQINYYGDTTPMINLAKLYQGGGVNYLTHTTSMWYYCNNGGISDNINSWVDNLNWNIFFYNGNEEQYDPTRIHYIEGIRSNDENYPDQSDCIAISGYVGNDVNKDSKVVFHLKKSAFKNGDGYCRSMYTFSFEIAGSSNMESHVYSSIGNHECGIKVFNDEDDEENDTPMYEEIWGKEQQIIFNNEQRVAISFVPEIKRNDPASQGIKVIIYGGEVQLCVRKLQLERGNIPSDWKPALEELADGTYKSELDEMRNRYTS